MVIAYLDTSAAIKLLVEEPESQALSRHLQHTPPRLVASWLLHTELHCAANRRSEAVAADSVVSLLDAVVLVDVTRGDLLTAATLPGGLRSNDAIHLATALRLGVDQVLTYDRELAAAAREADLTVLQPGAA